MHAITFLVFKQIDPPNATESWLVVRVSIGKRGNVDHMWHSIVESFDDQTTAETFAADLMKE